MKDKKENILDYQEFYEELKDGSYLPLRIDFEWLLENENYMRENLYSFYLTYSSHKRPNEIMKLLFKLYSEVILHTYNHFEGGKYL